MHPADSLSTLLLQEKDPDYDVRCNPYFAPSSPGWKTSSQSPFENLLLWRMKIAEWSFDVVDHFDLDREAAITAVNYVDKYASLRIESASPLDKIEFQLVATTALYLSIKLHGKHCVQGSAQLKPGINHFVPISKGIFTVCQISAMELKILQTLMWKLNPPLPVYFVSQFIDGLLPDWETSDFLHRSCATMKEYMYQICRYLAEVSVCFADLVSRYQSSVLAYASILVALVALERDANSAGLMPPRQTMWDFCCNVASRTSLTSGNEQVANARETLIERCPNIFAEAIIISACRRTPNSMAGFGDIIGVFRPGDQDPLQEDRVRDPTKSTLTEVIEEFENSYRHNDPSAAVLL